MRQTFIGHPVGLVVLFFTESCERFSYYGMRAILALYLIDHFLFKESVTYEIVAVYGSLVYFMPVIGGFIADRWLGFKKSVIFGAVLLCVGHALMAFEGTGASVVDGAVVRDQITLSTTFLAMSFIVVGVGFLKACISNMVGLLYEENDAKRDQGFTIFYFGINLGAMLAVLACGWLGQNYGWGWGFGLAGIFMLFGLAVFIIGRGTLKGIGEPHDLVNLHSTVLGIRKEWWIYIGGIAATFFTAYLLQSREYIKILLYSVGLIALLGVLIYAHLNCTKEQLQRLWVMLYLIVVSVIFWGLFEQAAHSLKGFALRNLDPLIFGISFEAAQIESFNPAFILIFSPVFVWLWHILGKLRAEPSRPMKFGIGIILCGVGYGMFLLGCLNANNEFQVAMVWVVLGFLFITLGELCISPVGLSMITRYSPVEMVGVMMGVWFLASSIASLFGGFLSQFAAIDEELGSVMPRSESLLVYEHAFTIFTVLGVCVGIFVALTALWLRRYLGEDASDRGVKNLATISR